MRESRRRNPAEWILGERVRRRARRTQVRSTMRKIASFADLKKLDYLVNSLEYTGRFFGEHVVEIVVRYLSMQQKKGIISEIEALSKRRGQESKELVQDYRDGLEDIDQCIVGLAGKERLQAHVYRLGLGHLTAFRERTTAGKTGGRGAGVLGHKLIELAGIFSLGRTELEVLALLYLIETDNNVDRLYDDVSDFFDIKNAYSQKGKNRKTIMTMTGLRRIEVDHVARESSTLMRSGLLDSTGDVTDEVVAYLSGTSRRPISEKYFAEFTGDAVGMSCHTVAKEHVDTVTGLWKHKPPKESINILLHGEPGTGKTEFARSLGRDMGLTICEIKNACSASRDTDEKETNSFRHHALLACEHMIDTSKSLIIVDEADSLLNSTPAFLSLSPVAEKGRINKVLDTSSAFVVWITNRSVGIDNSTRRRFDYSIAFEKFTYRQRVAVWRHVVRKHHMSKCFTDADCDEFSQSWESSAGGIDVAVKNAARVYRKTQSRAQATTMVRNIMKAHLKILDQKENGCGASRCRAPAYSLEGLNIKGNTSRTMSVLDRFNARWEQGLEESPVRNMNLLLHGPPGTGKTEFARYVARRFKRRLLVKQGSDLINCFVGETEKAIRLAFSEAERDKAILFIDEADSFLYSREGAVRSWEVTLVNEMLTNMESFHGMLVCATNFKEILDSAAIRRFGLKLEFDYLTPAGSLTFYELFLGGLTGERLSRAGIRDLGSMTRLTPGDFKVVRNCHCLLDPHDISNDALLDALRAEMAVKQGNAGRKMGFV